MFMFLFWLILIIRSCLWRVFALCLYLGSHLFSRPCGFLIHFSMSFSVYLFPIMASSSFFFILQFLITSLNSFHFTSFVNVVCVFSTLSLPLLRAHRLRLCNRYCCCCCCCYQWMRAIKLDYELSKQYSIYCYWYCRMTRTKLAKLEGK